MNNKLFNTINKNRTLIFSTSTKTFTLYSSPTAVAPRKQTNLFFQNNIYNFSTMSRPSVYITRKIKDEAVKLLKEKYEVTMWPSTDPVPREELLKNISGKQGLFCTLSDKIDKQILDTGNQLKVIATMSVGCDHLDVEEMKKRKIRVGYTPAVLADATAELTVALLLATSRRLFEANHEARTGGWQAWAPEWLCGPGLKNSTVGIAGFGRIGQQVAQRVKAFNCREIIYFNRSVRKEAEALNARKVSFDEFLTQSDFVIVCLALTPETSLLFNEAAFAKMKKTAVFVNTSRGSLVDQEALVKALQSGEIWGAGLDVTTPEPLPLDHALFKLKNCVVLPHIGSAAIETRDEMAFITARNIIGALEGGQMPDELV